MSRTKKVILASLLLLLAFATCYVRGAPRGTLEPWSGALRSAERAAKKAVGMAPKPSAPATHAGNPTPAPLASTTASQAVDSTPKAADTVATAADSVVKSADAVPAVAVVGARRVKMDPRARRPLTETVASSTDSAPMPVTAAKSPAPAPVVRASTPSVAPANMPLSVTAGPGTTITSGDVYHLLGWFSPGASHGPWVYAVNWGTGAPTSVRTSAPGMVSATRRFLAAGTYTVMLNVTDNARGTGASGTTVRVLRMPVGLDIQPGDARNAIRLSDPSNRDVKVAVLSSARFDPRLVDLASVRIGSATAARKSDGSYAVSYEDVNGDGRADLVLRFHVADLITAGGLTASSTSMTVTATLTDGRQITASDAVRPITAASNGDR